MDFPPKVLLDDSEETENISQDRLSLSQKSSPHVAHPVGGD